MPTASLYVWQMDAVTAVAVPLLGLAYLFLAGRYGTTSGRALCFGGAFVLLAVALWSPLHHLGLHYLLSAHLLQNVILAEWAPLLLVLSVSPAMAAAAARFRVWRALTLPAVALPLWLASYYAWHLPPLYEGALRHPDSLLHLEHASYLVTGVLMWWPLLQDLPRRATSGFRAAYAFAAFVLGAPLGLMLALLPNAAYDFYAEAVPRVWGLSPLGDQQLAGIAMVAEQGIVLFAVFVYWFQRFLVEEGAT